MFVLLQNTQGECVGVLLMHIIMIKPHTSYLLPPALRTKTISVSRIDRPSAIAKGHSIWNEQHDFSSHPLRPEKAEP